MEKKIRILPGGPYLLDVGIPVKDAIIDIDCDGTSSGWREGKTRHEGGETVALCRCGHSQNKPFCDGAHTAIGFAGTELSGHPAYMDDAKRYVGEEVDLLDNEDLCSSMRFCERGIGVWEACLLSGSRENRRLAFDEAAACASGRLTVVDKAGNVAEPELPQEVGAIQDTAAGRRGPLWVKGGIALEGADGQPYEVRNRMTLCRCGESRNMPYCDISHMGCTHMEGFDS